MRCSNHAVDAQQKEVDMVRCAWRIVVLMSVVWASQSAIAAPRPQQDVPVLAASVGLPDATADRVLGQAAFNTNSPGTSATTMNGPAGIAIAPPGAPNAGRLFVVEYGNHRVLSWPSAGSFVTNHAADLVIGQADFTSSGGALGQNRFDGPEAAVVDSSGRLWVADTENNRVLRFDPPFSNGMNASQVLGQPDYMSNASNQGGSVAANTLFFPRGLAMDAAGNLYVADDDNHRVLRFSPSFEDNMNASLVIGQANFNSGSPNRGGVAGQDTLYSPKGIAVDHAGNLYVAEYDNHRVTRYAPPLSDGMAASGVYGQPNYTSTTENNGGIGPGSLSHPIDIAVSAAGDALFVTDQWNVRVLGYSNPLGDAIADQVYGQPNFTSATANNGGVSAISINEEPLGVAIDANGNLYHADFRNHRLLAYDAEVIGNGTPGSCTESALNTALADGGSITFNCGTTLIDLSSTKTINANTTIDGGGKITLSGQDARQLFIVNPGATLTLRNIVLTDGFSSGDGGAIYNHLGGALNIENSTIRNSKTLTASGGAIVSYGPLVIANSRLEGNQALNGGALYPRFPGAQTTIVDSVLYNNRATDTTNGWGGAILAWDGAPVTIKGSDIYSNSAQFGGGIYNFANSVLALQLNTRLRNNVAGYGGGLYNDSQVTLSNVTLSGNSAGSGGGLYNNSGTATLGIVSLSGNSASYGGGLFNNNGTATLDIVTFSGNSASSSGGGLFNSNGMLTLINATFSGNSAGSGGGLVNSGTATLTNATFSGNSAGSGGGLDNTGTATLTNATFSGNSASTTGGGLINVGTAALTNVTLSGNSAGTGGDFYNGRTLTIKNTIVANSLSGGNCYNDSFLGANIASAGYNISSDNTCALTGTGDRNSVDPLLSALGNYGGPTQVHMLKLGSPAIDGILGTDAPYTDQRGVARPQGGGYDIGAVERRSTDFDLPPRVYMPMVPK
jgi:sugar lactone lactonase YvrE